MNPREHLPSWGQPTAAGSARGPVGGLGRRRAGQCSLGRGWKPQRREGPYPCPSFGGERPLPKQCVAPHSPASLSKGNCRHSEGAETLLSFSGLCTLSLLLTLFGGLRRDHLVRQGKGRCKLSCLASALAGSELGALGAWLREFSSSTFKPQASLHNREGHPGILILAAPAYCSLDWPQGGEEGAGTSGCPLTSGDETEPQDERQALPGNGGEEGVCSGPGLTEPFSLCPAH